MKQIVFGLLALTLSLQVQAQKKNSLLWEITGKGLTKPSYLYGTLHITCDASLKPKVLKALDETERLFLEINMSDPNLNQRMMGNLTMKDGQKLSDLMTKEDAEKVDSFLKSNFGMGLQMVDIYKPFFLQTLLYTKMIECPMQSYELELIKITNEQKETIDGLESIESQLEIFDKIPYKDQVKDLLLMIENVEKKDFSEMNQLIKLYNEENLDGLIKLIKQSELTTTNEFDDLLLVNRNKNWVPIIIEKSKEKPTFFGVGAAHLPGNNGVIKLLQKQGFKVRPVLK